jgi:hypothetical protein
MSEQESGRPEFIAPADYLGGLEGPAAMPPYSPIRPRSHLAPENVPGRDELIARWYGDLEARSLLIHELRKTGKTSALRRMALRQPPGWVCLYFQAQKCSTGSQLVAETINALGSTASLGFAHQLVDQLLSLLHVRVEVDGGSVELASDQVRRPYRSMEIALAQVSDHLRETDRRLVIVWDEFSEVVKAHTERRDFAGAEELLNNFAAWGEDPTFDRVRWLVTGSTGLHNLLLELDWPGWGRAKAKFGVSALPVLTREWTYWLIQSLLLGVGAGPVADDHARYLAGASGGIPILAHLMVGWLADHPGTPLPASAPQARALLAAASQGDDGSTVLDGFFNHIDLYYKEKLFEGQSGRMTLAAIAKDLLDGLTKNTALPLDDLVALAQERLPKSAEVRDVALNALHRLEDDHYIRQPDGMPGTYAWRYPAFRTCWAAYRGIHED